MMLKPGDVVNKNGVDFEIVSIWKDCYGMGRVGRDKAEPLLFYSENSIKYMQKLGILTIERGHDSEGCGYHSWKKYVGFNEVYEYCSKCDVKRPKSWREIKDEKEY